MTIEVGVVKGNVDRVVSDIQALFKEATAAGINTNDLEQRFNQVVLRAKSFLKHLQTIDSNESLAETVSAVKSEVSDLDRDSKPEPKPELKQAVQSEQPAQTTEIPQEDQMVAADYTIQIQLDSIQVQLSELLMKVSDIADHLAQQENVNSEPKALDDLINRVVSGSAKPDQSIVSQVMQQYGESIMQPSQKISDFWDIVLQSDNFNQDQKTVLRHLKIYQENLLKNKSDKILPSPWNRGMKDLFE